jgi:ergothioneine biosynthesis protein EgtB
MGLQLTDRATAASSLGAVSLLQQYRDVRAWTEKLCEPLAVEDQVVQSMPDASPTKWHLAHTSWFFETFVLTPYLPGYESADPQFAFLFNSYYNAVGPRWPRPERGLLTRPTVAEVFRYRATVDRHMADFLGGEHGEGLRAAEATIILGLHHEQQHQELVLTDLKHLLSRNPLRPVYREAKAAPGEPTRLDWLSFPEGMAWVGHAGDGFAFDNESPRHRIFQHGYQLASRLVTNEEYFAFIADGGYEKPELWLSEGWNTCQERHWQAPLYWEQQDGAWWHMTLGGFRPVTPGEPVCHVSFYEADALARWAGSRLPTEFEWEIAAADAPVAGHFLEKGNYHPASAPAADERGPLFQLLGDVWQWTASPYIGYPGYQPPAGALGEYNGKFMCNQFVLRGASCATPRSHARRSYRNFFPPDARWQFTGIRLARDIA